MRGFRLGFALGAVMLASVGVAQAQQVVKIAASCALPATATAVAPWAVAAKMGWLAAAGVKPEFSVLASGGTCVDALSSGAVKYALPPAESMIVQHPPGFKIFYIAYQNNINGIGVPVDSPIKTIEDLKGKAVGASSLTASYVSQFRGLATQRGLTPDTDVKIIPVGNGAPMIAALAAKTVDAVLYNDATRFALENAGLKLRPLDWGAVGTFPGNGIAASDQTLKAERTQAVAISQAYTKGVLFTINNPTAAARMAWEIFPETKPAGMSDDAALKQDVQGLINRQQAFKLDIAHATKWGEIVPANVQALIDFDTKFGGLKDKVSLTDVTTNDLIADINKIDVNEAINAAKNYK